LQIEQVPGGAAEREELRTFSEDLDLARRAEHGADVAVLQRGARVWLIRFRARHLQRLMPAPLTAPPLDVDDVEEPALRVGQEDRANAVGQAEQALDGRRGFRVRGC